MPYTEQELLQELVRCYTEEGNTLTKTLNDKNTDYPTQMTYQNRFGSLNNAREKAGVPIRKQAQTTDRESLIVEANKMYEEFGNIKSTWFQEKDKFTSTYTLYFDSFEELLKESDYYEEVMEKRQENREKTASIVAEKNSYDEEYLLDHLQKVYDEYGTTSTTLIEKINGPSPTSYRTHFGSLPNARDIVGIEDNNIQGERFRRVINSLDEVDGYDDNADSHIYVLQINTHGKDVFYVGQSSNLSNRLKNHCNNAPEVSLFEITEYGKAMKPRDSVRSDCEAEVSKIEYCIPLYQEENESDTMFRRRVLERERKESYVVALEHETTNVYGGR